MVKDQHGSAREDGWSNKLDNFQFCLKLGCKEWLTSVEGDHENLVIHYECEGGHKGSKCLTQLVGV